MKKLQDLVDAGDMSVESLINTNGILSETQEKAFILRLEEVQAKQQELRKGMLELGYPEDVIQSVLDSPVYWHIYYDTFKRGGILPYEQEEEPSVITEKTFDDLLEKLPSKYTKPVECQQSYWQEHIEEDDEQEKDL